MYPLYEKWIENLCSKALRKVVMSRECRECGGELEIQGTGYLNDTIEVECSDCGEFYEVEPDGLGEAGMEFVEAQMKEMERQQ